MVLFAERRGVTEDAYMRRTTLRMFQAHVAAYLREKFMLLSAMRPVMDAALGALGVATSEPKAAQAHAESAPAKEPVRRVQLPRWYTPPPGFRGSILSVESPRERLAKVAAATQDEGVMQRQIEREMGIKRKR